MKQRRVAAGDPQIASAHDARHAQQQDAFASSAAAASRSSSASARAVFPHSADTVRLLLSLAPVAIISIIVALLPRMPQNPAYHDFADKRVLDFGAAIGVIPHAGDVLSNLPFVLVGLCGIAQFLALESSAAAAGVEPHSYSWLAFFVGVLGTGVGSAYYHMAPDNMRLFYDRLFMAVAITSFVSVVISERLPATFARRHYVARAAEGGHVVVPPARGGGGRQSHEVVAADYMNFFSSVFASDLLVLLPLLAAGVWSAVAWRNSELEGLGDLRFFGVIQFMPLLVLPMIVALTAGDHQDAVPEHEVGGGESEPKSWKKADFGITGADVAVILLLFILSKVCEGSDRMLLALTGVSGHSWKHLTAAFAAAWAIRVMMTTAVAVRRRVAVVVPPPQPPVVVDAVNNDRDRVVVE